jgi:adenylate cyclase
MAIGERPAPPDSAQRAEVRAQLERLLSAPAFASSVRRSQLLRYLVERVLSSEGEGINEYSIGLDVFERPPSFDPRVESIVRTEATRLRQKLKAYYAKEGRDDPVLIEIPLRSYEPAFVFRQPEVASVPVELPPAAATQRRWPVAFIAVAVLGLLAGGGTAAIWLRSGYPSPQVRSLVVLPFQNLSSNAADEYLSDGLTDELTNELANWKEIRVVARTSAYQYKGKGEDVRKIGRELNTDAVLEGSLARQGDHIRITAQLNRTANGYHLWSHSYDARSLDMLTVQREIAQAIAAAIRGVGVNVPSQVPHPSTNNPEALDLFLRACYQYARLTPASVEASIGLFQAAIAKDPSYARAYAGLAAAEAETTNFLPDPDATARSRAALEQALKLDPDLGDAHGLMASMYAYTDGDWPRGEREYQLAIEKGAQPSTRAAYGWTLANFGRFQEAQAQCVTAETLEPLGVAPRFCQFYVYYFQRQYASARKMLMETLDLKPDFIYAHTWLGQIALIEKDCAEAARQFDWTGGKLPAPAGALGRAYVSACRGEADRARGYLKEAAAATPRAWSYDLAKGYALLRDNGQALAYLQQTIAKREPLGGISREPMFDGLRSDPRYLALAKTVRGLM